MKQLISLLMLLAAVKSFAAKPVAMVENIKGHAFVLNGGITKELKVADLVEDMSEVMVEEGALLTLRTSDEQLWHISSGGHVNFLNKIVELKKGQVWFQNKSPKTPHEIQTANASVAYWGGEGIVAYDSVNNKTQFLSISGSMEFSNILDKDQTEVIDPGKFSFVDDELDNGKPRKAVSIGKKSYDQFIALFPGIAPINASPLENKNDKNIAPQMVADEGDIINQAIKDDVTKTSKVKREIASVPENKMESVAPAAVPTVKKDFIIRRLPAQVEIKQFNLDKFNDEKMEMIKKEKAKRKFVPTYNKKSNVVVKIFGVGSSTSQNTAKVIKTAPLEDLQRAPASVEAKMDQEAVKTPPAGFESELVDEYKKQMRHSNETNNLINELKSYKQDYQKEY